MQTRRLTETHAKIAKVPDVQELRAMRMGLGFSMIVRRIVALAAGGVLLLSLLFFAYRRNKDDRGSFFAFYPVDLMSPGYRKQVAMFKQIVPKGSTVIYLMDKYEPWQSELWQRSLTRIMRCTRSAV